MKPKQLDFVLLILLDTLSSSQAWIVADKSDKIIDNPVPIDEEGFIATNGIGQCRFEASCRNNCDQVRITHTRFCQCDSLCWLYGDCCRDYYTSCLGVDVTEPGESVLVAVLVRLKTYHETLRFYEALVWRRISSCESVNGRYMQVVRACSEEPEVRDRFQRVHQKLNRETDPSGAFFFGATLRDVTAKCVSSNPDDVSPTLPVSLNKGHVVHFYNVFCAICNGLDPYTVQTWNMSKESVNKTSIMHGALLYDKKRDDFFTSTSAGWRWCLKGQDRTVNGVVNAFNLPPRAEDESLAMGRTTSTNASLCLSKDPSELRLCRSYQRPVVILEKGVFLKNRNCAVCDGASTSASCALDHCICPEEHPLSYLKVLKSLEIVDVFPNLKQVFYFREEVVTRSVAREVTMECPENQVFAPFYDHCVDVQCPPETTVGDGRCVGNSPCDVTADNCTDDINEENMAFPRGSKTVTLTFAFQYIADRINTQAREQDSDKGVEREDCTGRAAVESCQEEETDISVTYEDSQPLTKTVQTTHRHQTESGETGAVRVNPPKEFFSATSLTLSYITSTWVSAVDTLSSNATLSILLDDMRKIVDDVTRLKGVRHSLEKLASCPTRDFSRRREQCVAVVFSFNDSSQSSAVMSAVERLALEVMIAAHKSNFAVTGVSVTNADIGENSGSSFQRSLSTVNDRLCSYGRRAEVRAVNVIVNENGTFVIKTNGSSAYPLSHFAFSLDVLTDEVKEETRFSDTADVLVCLGDDSAWNCTAVFYNSSSVVEYQNRLIITRHASALVPYLHASAASNRTVLSNILKQFAADYNDSDIEVHEQGSYVMNHYGAYVCSNYSKLYTFNDVTRATYRFVPTTIWELIATGISLAVSIASLLTVLAVYSLVPDLRNTPGKIVMSLSGSLLAAQVMFLCSRLPRGLLCEVYAAVQHALWLSSSAWLAVMAVHLTLSLHRRSKAESGSELYVFAAFCWGTPCLMSGCCLALDRTGLVAVEYGSGGVCWFGNLRAMSLFFGLPLFLMVAVTVVSAAFIVAALKRSSDLVHKVTRDRGRARNQLVLSVNLSLLMGLGWAVYFVAILADTWALWVLFILADGSRGFFVFICYVARRSVRRKLAKRWGLLGACASSADTTTKAYSVSVNVSA